MNTIIEYKGRLYPFTKNPNYTENMFLDRSWFIVKNIEQEMIESFADLWISVKYYKTEYSKEIMEKINSLESNMMS
jgi:hypothetical protein